MSVDVVISQDANGECQEMVAGFAGGEGHGGFSTHDKSMVKEWLDIYFDAKILPVARQHQEEVLSGVEACPCLAFTKMLHEAAKARD